MVDLPMDELRLDGWLWHWRNDPQLMLAVGVVETEEIRAKLGEGCVGSSGHDARAFVFVPCRRCYLWFPGLY